MKELDQVKQIINSMVANSSIGAMKISSTILISKINKIEKKLSKEKQIELAVQQMTGFKLGKWGAEPTELISSMGLTKEEWSYIKRNEDSGRLDKEDIKTIDNYYAKENNCSRCENLEDCTIELSLQDENPEKFVCDNFKLKQEEANAR